MDVILQLHPEDLPEPEPYPDPDPPDDDEESHNHVFNIRVSSWLDGSRLSGAKIYLDGSKKGTTNSSGRLSFEVDPHEYYEIEARKDGYESASKDKKSGPPGRSLDISFQMKPE